MLSKQHQNQRNDREYTGTGQDTFTFLVASGVAQMGKARYIRIRKDKWDEAERFLRKPTFVTLQKVDLPD
jgi:hypothetical protein